MRYINLRFTYLFTQKAAIKTKVVVEAGRGGCAIGAAALGQRLADFDKCPGLPLPLFEPKNKGRQTHLVGGLV